MTVQHRQQPRMPQPEQWMSDHYWWPLWVVLAAAAVVVLWHLAAVAA